MTTFVVRVDLANGDAWDQPGWHTTVEVDADDRDDAVLLAQQLAMVPLFGMPEHLQITGAYVV